MAMKRRTPMGMPIAVVAAAVMLVSAGCQSLRAQAPPAESVRLAGIFSDHMVLQREMPVPIWGWAAPGGLVTVSLAGKKRACIVDEQGAWRVRFPAMPAGGPCEMIVSGKDTLRLGDILFGDVWLCAGQSNMEMHMRPGPDGVLDAQEEVAAANYPAIRLFTVPRASRFEVQTDIGGESWQACSPQSVLTFSAAGYFFGRALHEHLGVPIGLVNCSRGASPAEAWTSAEALRALPSFAATIEQLPAQIAAAKLDYPEYARRLEAYRALTEERDAGQKDDQPLWADPNLDTADWREMTVPEYWENAGFPDFDGVMWFRKDVELPRTWAGRPLELGLCTVNDKDRTYVNGHEVGRFEQDAGWTAPRVYEVPAEFLRPGKNTIAVRVFDIGNKGGICGAAEDLWLRPSDNAAETPMSLAGRWRIEPGLDSKTLPRAPAPPALLESSQRTPSVLFNAMVAPLIPFALRGAIWYQGESNVGRAAEYRTLFPAMIRDWRKRWGQGDFPFLFVQLASIGLVNAEPVEDAMAALREAQCSALTLPNTAMIVTVDIGDEFNVHPRNKQDVGRRLAMAARNVAYREPIVGSGPLYRSMTIEGNRIRIAFDAADSGLDTADGRPLRGFAIAGPDRVFLWADARIDGQTVLVSNPAIPNPTAVRYAWSSNPPANLINKEKLPASPFRTNN